MLNKDISNSQSPSPHKTNQRRRVHGGAIEKRISEKVGLSWIIVCFFYFKQKSSGGGGWGQVRGGGREWWWRVLGCLRSVEPSLSRSGPPRPWPPPTGSRAPPPWPHTPPPEPGRRSPPWAELRWRTWRLLSCPGEDRPEPCQWPAETRPAPWQSWGTRRDWGAGRRALTRRSDWQTLLLCRLTSTHR